MTEFPVSSPNAARPPLRTMVVDDEAVIRGPVGLCLETLGHEVIEAATVEEAVSLAGKHPLDIALVDIRLGTGSGLDLIARLLALQPRLRIIVISAYGSVDLAVKAMARGATDFLCKPFTPAQVAAAVDRAASFRALETDVGITDRWGTAGPEADFATTSAVLHEAIQLARRGAPAETPILLCGENGTGKSVLARAIHSWSRRPEGPFLAIDCGARSQGFIDLALFGETIAGQQQIKADQPPLLERAAGGTLLIKRVELLSPPSQERLAKSINARALEVDGVMVAVDCRVLATSFAAPDVSFEPSLRQAMERICIMLPPLRERADDIPLLAQRYLAYLREALGKQVLSFSTGAMEALQAYSWPGNLHELRTMVAAAIASCAGATVEAGDLPTALRDPARQIKRTPRAGDAVTVRDLEAEHIRAVLTSGKSLQEAAAILGLDPQALYRRRKQYGL